MSAGTSAAQLAGTCKITKCPDCTQEKPSAHFCSSCVQSFLVVDFWLVYVFWFLCLLLQL